MGQIILPDTGSVYLDTVRVPELPVVMLSDLL